MRSRPRSRVTTAGLAVGLAGTVAGLAAAAHVGPFAGLGFSSRPAAAVVGQTPLRADQLYPAPTSPPTIKQITVVQDPPLTVRLPDQFTQPAPTTGRGDGSQPSVNAYCDDDGCSTSGGGGGGGDD
ncbi:MAG: hypothetical protein NVS3B18_06440 [Candidatus Dormibacteria bacterium]